jgi:hypothetical protein
VVAHAAQDRRTPGEVRRRVLRWRTAAIVTTPFDLRVLRYGATLCGTFDVAGLQFTVHRDREHRLWVAVNATGDPCLHHVGLITGITTGDPSPAFNRVAIGARVLICWASSPRANRRSFPTPRKSSCRSKKA